MARCSFCKLVTELYDSGVPICVKGSDSGASKRKPPTSEHQVLNVLREDLESAKERVTAANEAFEAITSEIPSERQMRHAPADRAFLEITRD